MISLAPALAGAAGAGTAATALTTAATVASIASPVFQGIQASREATAQGIHARANADIGRTRAMQSDTVSRQNMESELSSLRATLGANGQAMNAGTAPLFAALRSTRARERRIENSNAMSQVADFEAQARSARGAGRAAVLGGLVKAAPSVFDLYQIGKKNGANP